MKYFNISLAVLLLTLSVCSPSFAGKAKGANTPSSIGALNGEGLALSRQVTTSETSDAVLHGLRKTSNRSAESVIDMSTASPVPVRDASGITSPLAGTYHIPGDFASIGAAVAVLNAVGASANVTFVLDAASYTENAITFGTYTGAGTYNVTVQPKAGVTSAVNFVTSASQGKGFAFNGANNVTINGTGGGGSGLTLGYFPSGTYPFPAGDAFAATVFITGGSQNITVKHTTIKGEVQGTFSAQTEGRPAVFLYGDLITLNQNIVIDSNTVINATFGFKALESTSSAFAVHSQHVWFTHNNVGGAFGGSVMLAALVEAVNDVHYDYNTIDGIEINDWYWNNGPTEWNPVRTFAAFGNQGTGGFLFNSGQYSGGHIYNIDAASSAIGNNVKDVHWTGGAEGGFIVYGLVVRIGGPASVYNNRVTGVQNNDPAGNSIGLRISSMNVYHNTVRFTGAHFNILNTGLNMDAGNARNNIFSNEYTGASVANTRAINAPGGVCDYNALYAPSGVPVAGFATLKAANTADPTRNTHSLYGNPNLDATLHVAGGPSSAENIGLGGLVAAADVDGNVRSLTTPDAGADEFANTGSPLGVDIYPYLLPNPLAGGVPSGLPVAPQVQIKNNSNQSVAGATVTITITDGYNSGVLAVPTIPSNGSVTVTAPNWTPGGTSWTIAATVTAAGDVNTGNDTYSRVQVVQPPVGPGSFDWNSGDQGWTRTVDFVRSSSFTKLGGPLAGSSMVTVNPLHPETYTEGFDANTSGGYAAIYPGANMLISPWFNLTSLATDVYVSFSQSLAVEPGWDGSWVEYTTNGVTWKHLGVANDPNGLNWYNHSVYANSPTWDASSNGPPDTSTMSRYGVGSGAGTPLPMGWWSSNGFAGPPVSVEDETGIPTGPFGYVYSQLHITAATYPDIVGAPLVKFRYVAFSDAVNPPQGDPVGAGALGMAGWAVDNFSISGTATVFSGGGISGTVSTDVDGSGTINGGDTPAVGKIVELKYFGVHVAYDTTDGAGAYGFAVTNPGAYTVTISNNPSNTVTDVPLAGFASVNHPSLGGADSVRNLAVYQGVVTGKVFEDVNNNGADNSEPGLAGWTVELHKDSCNGALYAGTVSIAGGVYAIPAAPGTWFAKTILLSSSWRNTTALCGGSVTVSGPSGGGAANPAGPTFGEFRKSVMKLFLGTDQNGNGVYDGGPDNFPLPFGVREVFDRKHNGVHQGYDTLGSTIDFHQFNDVDTGNYSFTILNSAPAGWVRTVDFGGTFSVNITTSGQNPTPHFLDFLPVTVSGIKFEDMNGDGILNGADHPLAGWKINLSGVGGGSATTDTAGAYSFSGVGGGAHVLSEVVQGGWQATQPVSGSYALNVTSGNLGGNVVRNFGNFHQISISGTKYRDRNGNGSRDFGDNGLSGWTINATNGGGAQVTDVNGDYSFTALGPGTYVLTETPQVGYTLIQPAGGNYSVTATSGVNVTARNFGNYQASDSSTYRTWTYNELKGASEAKPVKRPKTGKPILAPPNSANLIADLLTQPKLTATPLMQVGLSGQLVSGKEKGYLLPGKQSDVYATLNSKSVPHTATARPLAFYNDGIKRILKRLKSLPAAKGNNILLADLLTFRINLAASAKGQTDPGLGLGNLILCEAGHAGLSGKSLLEISYYADSLMTNWDDRGLPGTPSGIWTDLDTVVAKINAAFSTGLTTDTALGWTAPKLTWKLSANTAQSTGFLCAPGPGISPASNPVNNADLHAPIMPTVYALNQNYPNPFNPTTTLSFDLPENSIVTLKVYNMLGQEVATLYNNVSVDAGVEEVEFDASTLTSGVYFYRVTAQAVDDDGMTTGKTFTKTMKMMLVK